MHVLTEFTKSINNDGDVCIESVSRCWWISVITNTNVFDIVKFKSKPSSLYVFSVCETSRSSESLLCATFCKYGKDLLCMWAFLSNSMFTIPYVRDRFTIMNFDKIYHLNCWLSELERSYDESLKLTSLVLNLDILLYPTMPITVLQCWLLQCYGWMTFNLELFWSSK